jgi:hypothetical protein
MILGQRKPQFKERAISRNFNGLLNNHKNKYNRKAGKRQGQGKVTLLSKGWNLPKH